MRRGTCFAAFAAALLVLLLTTGVAADPRVIEPDGPPVRLLSPSHILTNQGTQLNVPPGTYYPHETHSRLDTEIIRLQTAETRNTAENVALRKETGLSFKGYTLVGAVGLVIGIILGAKAF